MRGKVSDLSPVTDEDADFVADEDETNECGVCGGTIVRIGSARYFKWRGKLRISEVWSCSECRTSGNRLISREDGRVVRLSPVFTGNGFEILEEDDRLVTDGGQSEEKTYQSLCCDVAVEDPEFGGYFPPECPDCGEYSGVYSTALVSRSTKGQLCPVADLPDAPARIRAYQYAIGVALSRDRSFARGRVLEELDLPVEKEKSVQRGLSDARSAGWIRLAEGSKLYSRGPLADKIVSSRSSGGESDAK